MHFESSIVKIDKDGNRVVSNVLSPGERLVNGQTYKDVQKNGIQNDPRDTPSAPLSRDDDPKRFSGMTLDETGTSTVAAAQRTPGDPTTLTVDSKQAPVKRKSGRRSKRVETTFNPADTVTTTIDIINREVS